MGAPTAMLPDPLAGFIILSFFMGFFMDFFIGASAAGASAGAWANAGAMSASAMKREANFMGSSCE
jgi:phosphate/sulfate permease